MPLKSSIRGVCGGSTTVRQQQYVMRGGYHINHCCKGQPAISKGSTFDIETNSNNRNNDPDEPIFLPRVGKLGQSKTSLQKRSVFHALCLAMSVFSFTEALHAAFVTHNGHSIRYSSPIISKSTALAAIKRDSRCQKGKIKSQKSLLSPARPTWKMAQSSSSYSTYSRESLSHLALNMSGSETDMTTQKEGIKSSKLPDDEEEWRTILAAFQMYKAAYGDLKVPSRFIVPAMAPWPESAWKLKLGQRVAAIRSTGKYVQSNESRRKILDDMGFLWRLRSPSPDKKLEGASFDQVYEALQTYRQQVQPQGALDVPSAFVVPDCQPWPVSTRGMPLGKLLPTVRSKSYLKKNPGAQAKLDGLGLEFDAKAAANDMRYQRVYEALVKYKEFYGDLLVPQPFTVPEDGEEWPDEVRGLRLGARVNAIRSQGTFVKADPARKKELDDLGFVWEPPANGEGKRRGRKRKEDSEDESEVSDEETEDEDDESGVGVSSLVASEDSDASKSLFNSRDPFFSGDQSSPPQWAFESDDDASSSEDEIEENKFPTPKSFNETLEEMAEMAMSVGIMDSWTPNKRVVKGAIHKDIPWYNDDFGSDFVFEDVVEALALYKEVYGSFDGIEEDGFVVPEPEAESLRLSPFELAAMNNGSPEGLNDELDEPWNDEGEDDFGPDNKLAVTSSSDWPEHLAGMKLGHIVSRIRDGGLEVKHLPDRKAQLDDIGFDWGDPKRFLDIPFEKVLCALYAYFLVRGDTFVAPDFLIPDEQPWPKAYAGFELGSAVQRLRELQNFLEAYHPVKMSLLRMVDFMFFPELALPLDPDAGEINIEHLYVETFGHPLYHISTVPLGLPERILADGPNGPPEKLSSWYNYDYVREYHERPGALTDVADWMRTIGFHQLAKEHEQKYGQSHFRQLFLLKERLDNKEITQELWDQEIERIQQEVMAEFENWSNGSGDNQILTDGEYDYTIDEDSYYYSLLEIGSSSSQDSQFSQPIFPSRGSRDVIEEPVAEFSLGNGDNEEF